MRIRQPARRQKMDMEVDNLYSGEGREGGGRRAVDPCAFYVVRVPHAVLSTDPDETLRVSNLVV